MTKLTNQEELHLYHETQLFYRIDTHTASFKHTPTDSSD